MPPTTCLYATMRDEGPWVLEWVAHHRAIGFDRIIVARNDCTDGTDALLDRLAELGAIETFENAPPYLQNKIQVSAYARARERPALATADWSMPLDADEFLNIHVGEGTVQDLIAHHDADIIAIPWRVFGSGDQTGFPEHVCDAFTLADRHPTSLLHIKALVRDQARFPELGEHAPCYPKDTPPDAVPPLRIVSASGKKIGWRRLYRKGTGKQLNWLNPDEVDWSIAQINHYMVKTRDVFRLRTLRGNAVGPRAHARRIRPKTFDAHDCNLDRDTTIARTAPARAAMLNRYLADPTLARLHAEARRITAERIAALRPNWLARGLGRF